MKKLQKFNVYIIWTATILAVIYNILLIEDKTAAMQAVTITIGTSLVVTVIYFMKLSDFIKSYGMLTFTAVACLFLSVVQKGNILGFICGLLILFLTTLYFDKIILLTHAATFTISCIIVYLINPLYISGSDASSTLPLIMIVMYIFVAGTLFITTTRGNRLVVDANEKSKLADEQHSTILRRSGHAKEITTALSRSVDDITQEIAVLSHSADTMDSSNTEILTGSQELIRSLSRIESNIASSNQTISTNLDIASELSSYYQEVLSNIMVGSSQGEILKSSVDEMLTVVTDTINSIQDLLREASAIHTILNELNGISSQTNLLSLNASIEAARVDNLNSGFGIVAQEIRGLSEQSKSASENMSQIIKKLIQLIERISSNIMESMSAVEHSVALINRLLGNLESITSYSRTSSSNIEQELELITKIRGLFDSVNTKVEVVISIANENASLVTTLSDSILEENKMIAGVTSNVETISAVANDVAHLFVHEEELENRE